MDFVLGEKRGKRVAFTESPEKRGNHVIGLSGVGATKKTNGFLSQLAGEVRYWY